MNLSVVGYNTNFGLRNAEQNYKNQTAGQTPVSNPLSQSNISFCGKNDFTRITPEELEKIKKRVEEKAGEMDIDLGYLWDMGKHSNITIQLADRLLNHKIIENESVKDGISRIISLTLSGNASSDAKSILDFADFILSDEVKDVYENESVKDKMGSILADISSGNIKPKKDLVRFINEHKEILRKDVDFGNYIWHAGSYSYDTLITNLMKDNPPVNPIEGMKTERSSSFGFDFRTEPEKKAEMGKKITKKSGEISGFERIGGQDRAIAMLKKQVIYPKKYPQIYSGLKPDKGAILYGPPGTGKSLMATAFAEEYGAYCVKIGASEMSEKWVGSSEENWRNLFEDLKAHQPALLFIDEIDALCKKRGTGDIHGDKELNQFLKLVSDIKAENLDVFILGATNNYEALDPAVLRDGRFGLHIEMLPPQTEKDVESIFNIHTRSLKMDKDVQENKSDIFKKILELGLSGAEIEGLVNNAHTQALDRTGLFEKMENDTVEQSDIDSFCVKAEDFFKAIEEKRSQKTGNQDKKPIGFAG